MSATRDGDRLVIRDADGDEVVFKHAGCTHPAVIDSNASVVMLTADDALAAASFLAEAVGVEGPRGCRFDGVPVESELTLPAGTAVLTRDEVDALPIGAVVDATVTGVRVRAMRPGAGGWLLAQEGGWVLAQEVNGERVAFARDLKDAVLVTDAPIQPAPTPPLPTEEGTALSAVVTRGSEARRLVVVRSSAASSWFSGALVGGQYWHNDRDLSDWRVIDPMSDGAVTS